MDYDVFFNKKILSRNPEFWKDYDQQYKDFELGELLKHARKEAGLTQAEIARRLNTTASVVSRWENHAGDLRFSTLQKYARVLNKNLSIGFV